MAKKSGPNRKAMSVENDAVLKHYGKLISKYRRASHYSRPEICESVNISNSQLSAWEAGKAEPRLHSMLKLCEFLNIPLEELLFDVGGLDVSPEEIRLIKILRRMPPEDKFQWIALLNVIYSEGKAALASPESADTLNTTEQSDFTQAVLTEEDIEPQPDPVTEEVKEVVQQAIKRKRGRPRKALAENSQDGQELVIKRKRGRPRKNPIEAPADADASPKEKAKDADNIPASPDKPKRGRPRKNP